MTSLLTVHQVVGSCELEKVCMTGVIIDFVNTSLLFLEKTMAYNN